MAAAAIVATAIPKVDAPHTTRSDGSGAGAVGPRGWRQRGVCVGALVRRTRTSFDYAGADAHHLLSDVWTTAAWWWPSWFGLCHRLAVVRPLIAIAVAIQVCSPVGVDPPLVRNLGKAIPEEERRALICIGATRSEAHAPRTNTSRIVPGTLTVQQGHWNRCARTECGTPDSPGANRRIKELGWLNQGSRWWGPEVKGKSLELARRLGHSGLGRLAGYWMRCVVRALRPSILGCKFRPNLKVHA